jgi:pseudaminic acid biosynthesis-associated methylase
MNEQEAFWAGEFGDAYTGRNAAFDRSRVDFFARALTRLGPVHSAVELGANVGHNLRALRSLYPAIDLAAVEINSTAAAGIEADVQVHRESLIAWQPTRRWDLAFTKGVLIHIAPSDLPTVYDLLHRCATRAILIAEYFSPNPVEVPYRGHAGRLFKRDFAGELLDRFHDLRLLDYGFVWRRDPVMPQDDITWFLLEQTA